MKLFEYRDVSKYNPFDRETILAKMKVVGGAVVVFQIIMIRNIWVKFEHIPFKYWILFLILDIVYFLYKSYIIGYIKKAENAESIYMLELQIRSVDTIRNQQEKCIKKYIKEKELQKEISILNKIKNFYVLNNATEWYVNEGCSIGDLILLKEDSKKLVCIEETKKARECGLPEDYYVIAKKDTHWLCCHAEEECIYAFSKTLGLTHTKYHSLYDYIIDTCNIPFDVEKDA